MTLVAALQDGGRLTVFGETNNERSFMYLFLSYLIFTSNALFAESLSSLIVEPITIRQFTWCCPSLQVISLLCWYTHFCLDFKFWLENFF